MQTIQADCKHIQPSYDDLFFDRLVAMLCPTGRELIAVMEAYFDDGGTHDQSPVMCVSGFLFNPGKCRQLRKAMAAELKRVQRKYPHVKFFHMKELAPGGGQFRDVPNGERQEIERRLVQLIGEYKTYGFTAALSPTEFYAEASPEWVHAWGQPYTVCVRQCLHYIGHWADRNSYFGPVAYVFESGTRHQAEANDVLNSIAKDPSAKRNYRYGSHAFVDKRLSLPLQAADVMAWLFIRTEVETAMKRARPVRKSMRAIGKGRGTDSANQMVYLRGDVLRSVIAENPISG